VISGVNATIQTSRQSASRVTFNMRVGFIGALGVIEALGLSFAKRAPTVVSRFSLPSCRAAELPTIAAGSKRLV
jgi:hypothetical protein